MITVRVTNIAVLGCLLVLGCSGDSVDSTAPDPALRIPEVRAALKRHYNLFEPAALAARVKRIRPHVEAVLGDSLGGPVKVALLSRDMAVAREVRRALDASGETDRKKRKRIGIMARVQSAVLFRTALGMLAGTDEGLYLLPDNFLRYPEADRPGLLDVVIAHELVHVYQARRLGLDPDDDEATDEAGDARSAAVEGHAEFVSRAVAIRLHLEAAFETLADSSGANDPLEFAAILLRNRFRYRQGERFFTAVARELGQEAAAKKIFREPPTSHWHIQNPARYLAGEHSSVRLAMHRLLAAYGKNDEKAEALLPGALRLQVGDAAAGVVHASRTHIKVAYGALRGWSVRVYAARCKTPAAARTYHEALKSAARSGGNKVIYPDDLWTVTHSHVVDRTDDALHAARIALIGLWGLTEAQTVAVRRGATVVQLVVFSPPDDGEHLVRLARRMLRTLDAVEPPANTAAARVQALLKKARSGWAADATTRELLVLLDDPDPEVRAAAATLVAPTDSDAARRFLKAASKHPDAAVRARAVARLGKHEDVETALADPHPLVRRAALKALAARKWFERAPVPRIEKLLADADPRVRAATLAALGAAERDPPGNLLTWARGPDARVRVAAWDIADKRLLEEALERGVRDDRAVRNRVMFFLSSHTLEDDPRVTCALVRALRDQTPSIPFGIGFVSKERFAPFVDDLIKALEHDIGRTFALSALANLDAPRAKAAVAIRIHDPDHRQAIVERLGKYRPAHSLLRQAVRDWDPNVRLAAAKSLQELGDQSHDLVPLALAVLRSVAPDGDAADVLGEAAAAKELGQHEAAARIELFRALTSDDSIMRWEAVDALVQFEPLSRRERHALLERLRDTDVFVRNAVASAVPDKLRAYAEEAVPLLIDVIKRGEDWTDLNDCIEALQELGATAKPALPALRKLLKHKEELVRNDAREAIDAINAAAKK